MNPLARRNASPTAATAMLAVVAWVAAAGLLLSGCGADGTEPSGTGPDGSGAAASPGSGEPTPTPGTQPQAEVLADRLEVPWGLAFEASGDALVTERISGRLLRLSDGTLTEVADLGGEIAAEGEGGLLGVAVSPPGSTPEDAVFLYLTTAVDNRVARLEGGSLRPVLTGIPRARIHNGGRLAFGPDGALYVTTGDAGSPDAAQDRSSLAGKILRIRPDGSIPADNPFPGSPVYSLGHRNVQGIAWDSAGRLWATEFGSQLLDEVNLITPGGNYGWPLAEGPAPAGTAGLIDPLVTWPTSEASPSGAAVVNDTLYVAALRGRRVWQIPLSDGTAGTPVPVLQDVYGRIRTLAVGPAGTLWLTTSNRDGRGEPGETDDRVVVLRPDQKGEIAP